MDTRTFRGHGCDLVFLSTSEPSTLAEVPARFAELAAQLAQLNARPFIDKVLCASAHRDEILAARAAAYAHVGLDPELPCTAVEGAAMEGQALAGVQIWAVVPTGDVSVDIADSDGHPGLRWRGDGYALVYTPNLHGQPDDNVSRQAAEMFDHVQAVLTAQALGLGDVARTWIYVARLLDWYGEFNQVRSAYFDAQGLSPPYPASTGIQGRAKDEACTLDLLTARGVPLTPITDSPRQDPASDYGSAFSRAMHLEVDGHALLLISGTASIDGAGRTRYFHDAEAQALDTLLNVASLLEPHGATLRDLVQVTVYCKHDAAAEAWRRICHLLQLPAMPAVLVRADVCRHELLIEVEAIAVLP